MRTVSATILLQLRQALSSGNGKVTTPTLPHWSFKHGARPHRLQLQRGGALAGLRGQREQHAVRGRVRRVARAARLGEQPQRGVQRGRPQRAAARRAQRAQRLRVCVQARAHAWARQARIR
jgi:hypothetical protein